jgi:hypothetical protein
LAQSSEGILIQSLPSEPQSSEALPSESLPTDELPSEPHSSEALPSESLPDDELPSEPQSSEALSGEGRPSGEIAKEEAELAHVSADHPIGDESGGYRVAGTSHDAADEAATDAVDTQSFANDAIEPLLEARLADWLPTDTQSPAGPEEDPGDLFASPPPPPPPPPMPMPSPLSTPPVEATIADSKQTTADGNVAAADHELTDAHIPSFSALSREREEGWPGAAQTMAGVSEGEAASQVLAAESSASALSVSPSIEAKPPSPTAPTTPPPLANLAPPPRFTPRAAPGDPLASMRALSEEELIALFS